MPGAGDDIDLAEAAEYMFSSCTHCGYSEKPPQYWFCPECGRALCWGVRPYAYVRPKRAKRRAGLRYGTKLIVRRRV